jgi:2'-5' RNA ligase
MRPAVVSIGPFSLALREVTGHDGENLFLNVKRGRDELLALHDRLYTGPLAAFLEPDHTYLPHLTVGRLSDPAAFAAAFAAALAAARRLDLHVETTAREICAHTIALDGRRTSSAARRWGSRPAVTKQGIPPAAVPIAN